MLKALAISLGAVGLSALLLTQTLSAMKIPSTPGKGDPTRAYGYVSETRLAESQALLKSKTDAQTASVLRQNASEILRLAPLNDSALLHLAIADILDDPSAEILPILEEVHKRNARNRPALIAMVDKRARTGDIEGVLRHVDLLYRLERDKSETYLTILDRVYQRPDGRVVLNRYLARNPKWGNLFLRRQIASFYNQFVSIDDLSPLVKTYIEASPDGRAEPVLVERYLYLLTELGRAQEASEFWHSLYVKDKERGETGAAAGYGDESQSVTFNPSFHNLDIAGPFNWLLYYTPKGGAQYNAGSGIYAFHNSEKPHLVARQYIKVKPRQSYTLETQLSRRVDPEKGRFEWRFNCLNMSENWGAVPITLPVMGKTTAVHTMPPVPAGCTFIDMMLFGFPGPFAERFDSEIISVRLQPVNAP